MTAWDYNLPPDWQPQKPEEWQWYLVRKINYNDLKGFTKKDLRKYFPKIQAQLDPGKRQLIKFYLGHE